MKTQMPRRDLILTAIRRGLHNVQRAHDADELAVLSHEHAVNALRPHEIRRRFCAGAGDEP